MAYISDQMQRALWKSRQAPKKDELEEMQNALWKLRFWQDINKQSDRGKLLEPYYEALLKSDEMRINPYPTYKIFRDEVPVYYSKYLGGWFISRYKDVDAILKNKTVSANRAIMVEKQLKKVDGEKQVLNDHTVYNEPVLGQADPPQHTKRRNIAAKAFAPKTTKIYETMMTNIIEKKLDMALKKSKNVDGKIKKFDLYQNFIKTVPYNIMAMLVGVPEDLYEKFYILCLQVEKFVSVTWKTTDAAEVERIILEGSQAHVELDEILYEIAKIRQKDKKNDMLSYLVSKETPGDEDTDLKMIARLAAFIVAAGSISISYQIPLMFYILLQDKNKEHLAIIEKELCECDDLKTSSTIDNMIDEIIRLDIPLLFAHRIATKDMNVVGKEILKDDAMVLSLASANHDPEKFVNPESLNFFRGNSKFHLGFSSGIHFCLGKHLAILEIKIVLKILFSRCSNLRLNPDNLPVYGSGGEAFRGCSSFPVLFEETKKEESY